LTASGAKAPIAKGSGFFITTGRTFLNFRSLKQYMQKMRTRLMKSITAQWPHVPDDEGTRQKLGGHGLSRRDYVITCVKSECDEKRKPPQYISKTRLDKNPRLAVYNSNGNEGGPHEIKLRLPSAHPLASFPPATSRFA